MSKLLPVAVLLASLLLPAPSQADDFFGPDKYMHALASMTLAQAGFLTTVHFQSPDTDPTLPWAIGATTALIPGVAKELFDATRPTNRFSWKDMAWNTIGTTAGLLISQGLWLLFQ